jgi:hypothetical protein
LKNRKLVLALFRLMVFALAGVAKAAEVPGEKSAIDLEALEQEAVSLLSEYLRVDTTNPPGNEIQAAQFFKAILTGKGSKRVSWNRPQGEAISMHGLKGIDQKSLWSS